MAAPRKDDVRKLILESTEELLKDKAFADISLSGIAEKAGISKGTLYYHFRNREDILFALMDDYLDRQWKDLNRWITDSSKDTSLPRLIKYVLERDTATAADMRFHFFQEAAAGNETVRNKLLERYVEFQKLIAKLIEERAEGADGTYLSWLALIVSDGLLMHKLMGNTEIDTSLFIRKTEDTLKAILGN